MASAHGGNRGPNDPLCTHAAGALVDNPEAPTYDFGFARDTVALHFCRCRYCFATMIAVWPVGTPPHPSAWKTLSLVLNAMDRSGTRAT
jgi:hypothetical protein